MKTREALAYNSKEDEYYYSDIHHGVICQSLNKECVFISDSLDWRLDEDHIGDVRVTLTFSYNAQDEDGDLGNGEDSLDALVTENEYKQICEFNEQPTAHTINYLVRTSIPRIQEMVEEAYKECSAYIVDNISIDTIALSEKE